MSLKLSAFSVVDVTTSEKISLLEQSEVLFDNQALRLEEVCQDEKFKPYAQSYVNAGVSQQRVWIKFQLKNRYKFLAEEKEKTDKQLLESFQNREKMITKEVKNKTAQLNHALKTKELLLKEVHHRIKNNLQIILSMVRLQNDKSSDKVSIEKFVNLENRINAIAKTYNLLLPEDDLSAIDMDEYVESLLQDIQGSMEEVHHEIETDINAMIPIRESVYIGIIINELITNAYKYAFEGNRGRIFISLHKEKEEYLLIVCDDGKGFVYNKESKSLGLKLIHALVYEQLKGSMEMKTNGLTQYTIRFRISS